MSQNLRAAEIAQGVSAIGSGGVVEEPAETLDITEKYLNHHDHAEKVNQKHHDNSLSGNETTIQEEYEDLDTSPRDLEATETAESATPAWSVFTRKEKRWIVFFTACAGFFSPLSANIYFPALNQLARDLNVSASLINLTLTSYMIFQGLAPTIFGDLADMAGRRPAYIIGFIIYIAACIGIALQNSFAALFILRCLQSTGSSGTIALGSGIVADISTASERGTYMGWATAGILIGPAIGPIIGGVLAQFLGWRSIFWFLVILAGVFLVPFIIFFPETGRNVVGDGSIPPQGWNMSVVNYLAARKAAKQAPSLARTISQQSVHSARAVLATKRKLRFPNPLHTLSIVCEKDMGLLLFYNSLVYTAFYDVTATIPYLFAQTYGFNDLQIGLCYIPFGVGSFIAPLLNGRLLDWNFRRISAQLGLKIDRSKAASLKDFPLEKARIHVAWPLVLVGAVACLAYGWVMQAETTLAAPLVLQFVMGISLSGAFNVMSVMLVDNYPMSPATATAGNNLVRCLMGAGGTAVIVYMIEAMGRGWCFTFIALVVLGASPILAVLLRWGPRWREERRVRVEAKKERLARGE